GMFAAPRCPEAVVLQWCLPERMPWPDVRVICRMHHLATLAVRLRPGLRVRYLITMSDMSPQASDAQARAGSWYRGVIVPPMDGNMNLAVQVWEGGTWRTARMTVCQVDNAYALHLLL
ncbi:MAG TPA: hypothetical protein VHB98_19765, partial [Chloroflexota bacterium]|nr:hypothetical protein [Chloroflexota bacterium]